MPVSEAPFGEVKFATIKGRRMAYLDEGKGDAVVFQHGNPTSSYLWRNVMPHCAGLARLVACDLIGMGRSDKLGDSGPGSYSYSEQRDYLFALWERLNLGDRIVLVLHDWGSALGFDWAHRNPERVQGIAYMEAIVAPLRWADWPESARKVFQGFRSDSGEEMVLEKNAFVEKVLPASIERKLSRREMEVYRAPFAERGETRRPTLSWPRQLPIEGQPKEVVETVGAYGKWLQGSPVPKLFVNAEPGSILVGRQREFCRSWANQEEVTVRMRSARRFHLSLSACETERDFLAPGLPPRNGEEAYLLRPFPAIRPSGLCGYLAVVQERAFQQYLGRQTHVGAH
jgi:haloalkane dehalogenase